MKLFSSVKRSVINGAKTARIKLDDNGPKWAILGGAGLLVGAGILACYKTTKADYILEDHKKRLERLNEATSDETLRKAYNYTDAEVVKDTVATYAKTGVAYIKHYALPISMAALGITGILWGTKKFDSKVKELTIAAATVTQALVEYRKRVADEVGTEKEEELYFGQKPSERVFTDPETGEERKVKVLDSKSPYSKLVWGPYNDGELGTVKNKTFDISEIVNYATLCRLTKTANRQLETVRMIFLRDLLKELDMECPAELLTAGWIVELDEDGKLFAPIGDAYIDLGFAIIGNAHERLATDKAGLMAEFEQGIANAEVWMLNPNCVELKNYIFKKQNSK